MSVLGTTGRTPHGRAVSRIYLNPPPADPWGFLAQEAPRVSDPEGLTPSTPAGTEPARFGTATLWWHVLGSRSARRTVHPVMSVFRPQGERPFPALLRRSPIPSRPKGQGILGGSW